MNITPDMQVSMGTNRWNLGILEILEDIISDERLAEKETTPKLSPQPLDVFNPPRVPQSNHLSSGDVRP